MPSGAVLDLPAADLASDGPATVERHVREADPGVHLAVVVDLDLTVDPDAVGRALGRGLWGASEEIARRGVGVVLTGPGDLGRARTAMGRVAVPVTTLAERTDADAWCRGQLASGPQGVRPVAGGRSVVAATLYDYAVAHANPSGDGIADRLAAATRDRFGPLAGMNVGHDQGLLLSWLVRHTGARTVVEIGTFTGMSALWLARGLPEDGRLICHDVSAEYVDVGRPFWAEAGVADCIEVRIGPAAETLPRLADDGPIDLAFVDADKEGYATYVDALLPRLAPDGFVAIDNVLWSGAVLDADDASSATTALRALNDDLASRTDVETVMLTIGDGITLVRPR